MLMPGRFTGHYPTLMRGWSCLAGVFFLTGLTAMHLQADTVALLRELDLTRPELAAVKNAADRGDIDGAAAALQRYFRTRQAPRWYTAPPAAPGGWKGVTDAFAEKVLRREYTFVGKTATLTRDLNWNANPLKDNEWTIELNRHYTWTRLVDAYNRTGNPAYVDDFIVQLRDWCADNPRPSGPRQARFTWRTLECGIRLSGSWPHCFFGLLNSPAFTPDTFCLMLEALWEQTDYLTQVHGGGNWLVTETSGLMTCAVLFPEFVDAAKWREIAFARLTREIDQQVPPDGAQIELTPHYHAVTMRSFMQATRIAEFNGIPVPEKVTAGVLRMAHYLMAVSKPDFHFPMFNDSDHGTVSGRLRTFATDSHPEIEYVLSRGAKGTPPPYTSIALPYAGQYIMRSGWDEQALYLAMDAGPYGLGHQHEDKLQIDVHAFGRSHILDPGRFTYAGGPWRRYFVGTQSHSTMLVNGLGQNRRHTPRRNWVGRHSQDNLWVTNAVFDFAVGAYDDGYGNGLRDLVHIRKVFFKRGEYWIVHDLLIGEPDGPEDCTAAVQYQFGTTGVTAGQDGKVIVSHNSDANLAIFPISNRPLHVELHEGEEDPPKGWIAWSLHRALKTPATMAVIQQRGALPIRIDTLLFPYAGATRPNITVRRLSEDSPQRSVLEITGPGWRDVYRCSHGLDGAGTAGGGARAPRIEWTRYDGNGRELACATHETPRLGPRKSTAETATGTSRLPGKASVEGVTVTVPGAGRVLLDYGYAAGGGYLFHREQRVDAGECLLRLPSIGAKWAYVYSVQFMGDSGVRGRCEGRFVPEIPTSFDFQKGELGEWSGAAIAGEDKDRFLRARSKADTRPVYVSITHPLRRFKSNTASVSLKYRMPFANGGDWCYCKVSLTDTVGRHWSAYFASKPSKAWHRASLKREDFHKDDRGDNSHPGMPPDLILTEFSVTLRKGITTAPVAPILEVDDVSWQNVR